MKTIAPRTPRNAAPSDATRQPGLRHVAASLALLGFAVGLPLTPVAAETLLPKAQNPTLVRVGDPYFQRALKEKGFTTSFYSFPATAVGSESAAYVFSLENNTGSDLTFAGPPSTTGGAFITVAGTTCTGTLPYGYGGNTCTVAVKFRPTMAGIAYGNLSISTVSPPMTSSVSLEGFGFVPPMPVVDLQPDGLDFGVQPIGTESATQRVTLANLGPADLNVSEIRTTAPFDVIVCDPGAGPSVAQSGPAPKRLGPPCTYYGGSLAATRSAKAAVKPKALFSIGMCPPDPYLYYNESCYFDVVFAPQSSGTFFENVTVVSANAPSKSIQVTGTSGAAQSVSVSPDALRFGGVQLRSSAGPVALSVANSGFQAVTINSVSVIPAAGDTTAAAAGVVADYQLTSNCAALAPGAGCAAQVTFKPSQLGARNAAVRIEGTFEGSPKVVPLSGEGLPIPFPFLTFSVGAIGYGESNLGSLRTENFEIINSGQLPVTFTQIFARGDFTINHNCPQVLPAGQRCAATVTFRPLVPGLRLGEVVIQSNADGGTGIIPLSGTGCRPATARNARLGVAGCS